MDAPTRTGLAKAVAILALMIGAGVVGKVATSPPSPLATADRWFEAVAFRFFAPATPQNDNIVIVALTEETLDNFAYRSPIDREFLAELIRTISAQRPTAIGVDVLVDRPSEEEKDEDLRQAGAAGPTPVVFAAVSRDGVVSPAQRRYLDGFLQGLKRGNANLARDPFDDMIRDYVPYMASGEASFAAALATAAGVTPPPERFRIMWRRIGATSGSPFTLYPAHLVRFLPAGWLKGKIVLIGSFIPGQDEHRTPVSVFGRPTYGIEVHAQALSQILANDHRGTTPSWLGLGLALASAGGGMALAAVTGPAALIGGVVALAIAMWVGFSALFALGGPLLLPLAPTLSLGLGAGCVGFWRARRGRQDTKILRHMFSRFVSEPVLKELWKDRTAFLAGGRPRPQKLVATVLFSDIAGFTPICERLSPEPLVEWLDRYMEVMVPIVVAHEGVVLRFMGDGILAVFGAPVPRASDAEIDADAQNAVRCGLAMIDAMARLNLTWQADGLPTATIRIGIHTGPLVAGSLGSGAHVEYCLLGDTANTGARLEALGKQHVEKPGESILLVGSPTFERLRRRFAGKSVGEVSLKGKERLVEVYKILGPAQSDVPEPEAEPEIRPASGLRERDVFEPRLVVHGDEPPG